MAKKNQGFRKDLNLQETIVDSVAINNLAGAGIADDLGIIQNNLRNISTLSCGIVTNGFFSFPNNQFVFTDDDIVGVSTNVAIGATTLTVDTEYFVCNSNGETQFKLSLTPSILGINTIIPSNVNVTGITINFERKDAVIQDNILNYIQPQIQDTESFSYLEGNINDTIKTVSSQNETARFLITQKYRADEDRNTDKNLNYEGTISISDPVNLNVNSTGLSNAKSPGIYIGDTRAFSSDNNPWSEVGIPTSALLTNSTEVATAELNFADNITIEGITATSATSVLASTFTHKLPVVINGETYYLLLSA
jgi:hypothetical protein